MSYELSGKKIFVAGHKGLVGSAICRALQKKTNAQLITRDRKELDLRNQQAVEAFFSIEKPQCVFLAAAKVGGIKANDTYRGDFILENLQIQSNVIGSAFRHGVEKLVFLGSSCIYPKFAEQPIREDSLLTGKLEPTNEAYAVAKIAGIMLCKSLRIQYGVDYISLMPTNLYGPNDNYHPEDSHVIPALIRRFHEAKLSNLPSVTVWGSGKPRREFLYSDDLAAAAVFCAENYSGDEHLNAGFGDDVSIAELAHMVAEAVGYGGKLEFDSTKPDGTPKKLMDSTRLHQLGWKPSVGLQDGLHLAYQDFLLKAEAR
jgi:GDP-L-fucose synthase